MYLLLNAVACLSLCTVYRITQKLVYSMKIQYGTLCGNAQFYFIKQSSLHSDSSLPFYRDKLRYKEKAELKYTRTISFVHNVGYIAVFINTVDM